MYLSSLRILLSTGRMSLQAQVAPPSLLQPRQWYASQGRQVQIGIGGVAAFAGITLLIAVVRTVRISMPYLHSVRWSAMPQIELHVFSTLFTDV